MEDTNLNTEVKQPEEVKPLDDEFKLIHLSKAKEEIIEDVKKTLYADITKMVKQDIQRNFLKDDRLSPPPPEPEIKEEKKIPVDEITEPTDEQRKAAIEKEAEEEVEWALKQLRK